MDRERGYIKIHRRIRSSPVYRSLTAEQRSVFLSLLLLASWKDSAMSYGGKWLEVKRGEIAHSLERIADEAGTSVKVVRTTLLKLMSDDSAVGGTGPVIAARYVTVDSSTGQIKIIAPSEVGHRAGTPTGTGRGTGFRILRVVNYDAYQDVPGDTGTTEGTGSGSDSGMVGARDGHEAGTTGALLEEGKEGKKGKTSSRRASRDAPADPRHSLFVQKAHDVAVALGNPDPDVADGRSMRALRDFLARKKAVTVEAWEARWRRLLLDPKSLHKIWFLVDRWDNYATPRNGVAPPQAIAGRAKFDAPTKEDDSWNA